jgi:uncharacterized coiled-coil DUF342 family protein
MQLPGLDELEASVARAVEELSTRGADNARLRERLRVLGKEIDELADQIKGIGSGQKVDSKTKKRLEARLRSIVDKLSP